MVVCSCRGPLRIKAGFLTDEDRGPPVQFDVSREHFVHLVKLHARAPKISHYQVRKRFD